MSLDSRAEIDEIFDGIRPAVIELCGSRNHIRCWSISESEKETYASVIASKIFMVK